MAIYPASITPRGLRVDDTVRVPPEWRGREIEWARLRPRGSFFALLDESGNRITAGRWLFRTYRVLQVKGRRRSRLALRKHLRARYRCDPAAVREQLEHSLRSGRRVIGYVVLGWFAIVAALGLDLWTQGRPITPGKMFAAGGVATLFSAFWLVCGISVMAHAKRGLMLVDRWSA